MNSEATKKHKAIKCHIGNTAERISGVGKYLNLIYVFGECNTTQQHMSKVNCRYKTFGEI